MTLIDEAESLILHQFAQSPRFIGLVRSLAEPFQEVLANIESLYQGQYIEQAWGARLDILGEIVGQPRRGLDDDTYRAWKDVGIRLNIGAGTGEDVLCILKILLGRDTRFLMQEHPPNDVVFVIFGRSRAPLPALFEITKSATPVTTRCHFIQADLGAVFRLDMSPLTNCQFADFFKETINE